ncbi:hypothetical protein BB560_000098 [Smittium megazygosporum]|uniref:Uncharacterized protein n=1 Tax=Smittium megazygosporum TaxID=133381 RepID=A0A2T9ZLD4_9FUNG|nr:hypothetical protein BB560_000098 [Smittium megazygosporum]
MSCSEVFEISENTENTEIPRFSNKSQGLNIKKESDEKVETEDDEYNSGINKHYINEIYEEVDSSDENNYSVQDLFRFLKGSGLDQKRHISNYLKWKKVVHAKLKGLKGEVKINFPASNLSMSAINERIKMMESFIKTSRGSLVCFKEFWEEYEKKFETDQLLSRTYYHDSKINKKYKPKVSPKDDNSDDTVSKSIKHLMGIYGFEKPNEKSGANKENKTVFKDKKGQPLDQKKTNVDIEPVPKTDYKGVLEVSRRKNVFDETTNIIQDTASTSQRVLTAPINLAWTEEFSNSGGFKNRSVVSEDLSTETLEFCELMGNRLNKDPDINGSTFSRSDILTNSEGNGTDSKIRTPRNWDFYRTSSEYNILMHQDCISDGLKEMEVFEKKLSRFQG